MATLPSYFETVTTRDPSEFAFRVPADAKMLNPSQCPQQGDAYKDTNIPGVARVNDEGFGDYVYCYAEKDGPIMWFHFCKHKTEAQKLIPFNTFNTSVKERWPNVLNDIIFQADNQFPLSTTYPIPENPPAGITGGTGVAFAPNLIERLNITPETLALCLVVVEQFISDTPWSGNQLTHLQPTEGVVSWDFNGAKGSLTCLHGDIKIPARGKAYTTVIDGDITSSENAPFVPERVFPATNMEGWQPYVLYDTVVRENGIYFRERATIYPPEENEPNLV